MPTDNGHKYLLVVGDLGSHKIDCEPLKVRDATTVRDALKKIYARKIVKLPKRLEVDDGTEFKGAFKAHFSKVLKIITKVAGRSRQQAFIESKNGVIGEVLNTAMLSDEINNDATSRKWVYLVKDMVQLINEEYERVPTITPAEAPEKTNEFTKDILPEGTKVRTQLDKPTNYIDGKPEIGKFRRGDTRWSKEIKTITRFYLRPDQVPLYQVDNDDRVAYSRYQLQLVRDDEVKPTTRDGAQQYAQRITNKKTEKGKVMYEVEWEDKSRTYQPRAQLMTEIPDMIKEYEKGRNSK
jgi:hypothetical protein